MVWACAPKVLHSAMAAIADATKVLRNVMLVSY
jgi:hypothetical protein